MHRAPKSPTPKPNAQFTYLKSIFYYEILLYINQCLVKMYCPPNVLGNVLILYCIAIVLRREKVLQY
jgi:hypothetical protein